MTEREQTPSPSGSRSAPDDAGSRPADEAWREQTTPGIQPVGSGGHGYATVRLTGSEMRTEFVCIPRPITRSERPDGGPLRYRVVHTASLWKSGERPVLRQEVTEGDPGLSI